MEIVQALVWQAFGLIIYMCSRQVIGGLKMIVLLVISILVFVYLGYVLINPEKF